MVDIVKWHPNERVDRVDLDFLTAAFAAADKSFMYGAVAGLEPAQSPTPDVTERGGVVIDGWTYTTQLGDVLRIARGLALSQGRLFGSSGPLHVDVPFAPLGAATYDVWVRPIYVDGETANRAFIDPGALTQRIRAVPTRRVDSWQATARVSSLGRPGDEWVRVARVVWNATSLGTSTITDYRNLLFEGNIANGPEYSALISRSSNRAANGVRTLHGFAMSVLQKLEEIQGHQWYTAPPEELNKKVSRFGDASLVGDYTIDGNLTVEEAIAGFSLTATLNADARWVRAVAADSSTADPVNTSNARPYVAVRNSAYAVGNVSPMFFLHKRSADAVEEGVVLYSKRTGASAEGFELRLGGFEGGVFAADYWVFDLDNDTFRPAEGRAGMMLGTVAGPWNTLHAEFGAFLDETSMPWSGFSSTFRNQVNATVASCSFTSGASPSLAARHWNVATVTRPAQGIYEITFDQALDTGAAVVHGIEEVGGTNYAWKVTHKWQSATVLRLYVHLHDVGLAAYGLSDQFDSLSVAIIGAPDSIQA